MNRGRKQDTVLIEGLVLDCVIGINPWERLVPQRITLDISIDTDLSAAGESDAIGDTIDYTSIAEAVTNEVQGSSYGLIEALASRVAEICFEDPRVDYAEVTLRKPGAVRNAPTVGVTIRRSRVP